MTVSHGDIFPLPLISRMGGRAGGISRGVRQRVVRRNKLIQLTNESVVALNSLSMGPTAARNFYPKVGGGNSNQVDVLGRLFQVHRDNVPPSAIFAPEEALRQLLQVQAGYGEPANGLAPYSAGCVSLPPEGNTPCPIVDVLSGAALAQVKNWDVDMLLGPEEHGVAMESIHEVGCYMDPILQRNPKEYAKFVGSLYVRNLVRFSRSPQSRLGVFFVRKKSGNLRLIVDCRKINSVFKKPPKGHVVSSAVFGELQLHVDEQLYSAESDVKDFFYRLGIPDSLSDYFALEPVSVALLKESLSVDAWNKCRDELSGCSEVFPCFRVLPMGFSWSFYLAQEAHRFIASGALTNTHFAQDCRPVPHLSQGSGGACVIYADNATHLGSDPDSVNNRHQAVTAALEAKGLSVHEENEAGLVREPLGVRLDGSAGKVMPTQQRLWRLTQALRACHSGRYMSGRDMERLVGHLTFVLLLSRLSLSLLDHVYVFMRHAGTHRIRIWPCVVFELWRVRALLPFISSNLRLPWNRHSYMFDACLSGYGVLCGELTLPEIREVGEWNERWRFKFRTDGPMAPRIKGLNVLDPLQDLRTARPSPHGATNPEALVHDDEFPEVPAPVTDPAKWWWLWSAPFKFEEPIHIKEGRALVSTVKHICRNHGEHAHRVLIFSDNMSVVLAVSKGRCCDYKLLRLCQQLFALSLSCGLRLCLRWLPSERNLADGPSRLWEDRKEASHSKCSIRSHSHAPKDPSVQEDREETGDFFDCHSEFGDGDEDGGDGGRDESGGFGVHGGTAGFDVHNGGEVGFHGDRTSARSRAAGGDGDRVGTSVRSQPGPSDGSARGNPKARLGPHGGGSRRTEGSGHGSAPAATRSVASEDRRREGGGPPGPQHSTRRDTRFATAGGCPPDVDSGIEGCETGWPTRLRASRGRVSQILRGARSGDKPGKDRVRVRSAAFHGPDISGWQGARLGRQVEGRFGMVPPGVVKTRSHLAATNGESFKRLEKGRSHSAQLADARARDVCGVWRPPDDGPAGVCFEKCSGLQRVSPAQRRNQPGSQRCNHPMLGGDSPLHHTVVSVRTVGRQQDAEFRRDGGAGFNARALVGRAVGVPCGRHVRERESEVVEFHSKGFCPSLQRGHACRGPERSGNGKLPKSTRRGVPGCRIEAPRQRRTAPSRALGGIRHGPALRATGPSGTVSGEVSASGVAVREICARVFHRLVPRHYGAIVPIVKGDGECHHTQFDGRCNPSEQVAAKNQVWQQSEECHESEGFCEEESKNLHEKEGDEKTECSVTSCDDCAVDDTQRSIFLSLYGGCGRVAKKATERGLHSVVIDLCDSSKNDLGKLQAEKEVRTLLGTRQVALLGIELPCNSWSIARRGNPPPLRDSHHFVLGLPHLGTKDKERVHNGNQQYRSAVRLIRSCLAFGIPGYLENPKSSRLWKTPGFIKLAKDPRIQLVHLDQCQYNCPYKKATTLMIWNVQRHLTLKTCSGKGGRCSRTRKKHINLNNVALTKTAQEYSWSLATAIIDIFALPPAPSA